MAPRTWRAAPRSILLVTLAVLVVGVLAWFAVDAATEDEPTPAADRGVVAPAVVQEALEAGATPIDVRTPEEFAPGHLVDARNIDLSADGFEEDVAALDADAAYVVYCASGNRSTQAIERMTELGFADLVNGGGYEDLAASGLVDTERG